MKKCALCKKEAYASEEGKAREYWVCADCRHKVESIMEIACASDQSLLKIDNICDKCRKRSGRCRFSREERSKITACSDWEEKDTERNRRRWAKYE
ncbi:MAG: hypothetical protein RO469_09960 [Thermincola sp.]|nr:hypothetical protein [Thermincola sp.]